MMCCCCVICVLQKLVFIEEMNHEKHEGKKSHAFMVWNMHRSVKHVPQSHFQTTSSITYATVSLTYCYQLPSIQNISWHIVELKHHIRKIEKHVFLTLAGTWVLPQITHTVLYATNIFLTSPTLLCLKSNMSTIQYQNNFHACPQMWLIDTISQLL
jgi:glycerol kinase